MEDFIPFSCSGRGGGRQGHSGGYGESLIFFCYFMNDWTEKLNFETYFQAFETKHNKGEVEEVEEGGGEEAEDEAAVVAVVGMIVVFQCPRNMTQGSNSRLRNWGNLHLNPSALRSKDAVTVN